MTSEELDGLVGELGTKDDFARFLCALIDNLHQHPEEWEDSTLLHFLQGASRFTRDMRGYYQNRKQSVDLDVPEWRVFADILLAGKVYS